MKMGKLCLVTGLFVVVALGCAASETAPDESAADAAPPRTDAGPPVCGDVVCELDRGEDCLTCPLDCGECPTCDLAPTCTGAMALPTSAVPLEDCNNGDRINYACGTEIGLPASETDCTDPQLRVRIREIEIRRDDLIKTGFYCVVTAEDGSHSELLLSRRQEVASGTSVWPMPLAESVFWGQGDLYRSISNLTLTYECYLSPDASEYEQLFDEVSDSAADVADDGDGYGWVFGTVSVAGAIIAAALGTMSDERILAVQQTIDAGALLELTNSRTWTIEHHDDSIWPNAYDVVLRIQAWGCASARDSLD